MCTRNHNHKRYGSWETEWDIFFVILGHFLPFYPTNSPENQNFEKMKKESGDVTILHTCTTNHNHLMYASWNIECNKHFFFSFRTIFWPRKLKFRKNVKKTLEMLSYHTFTINEDDILYGSWDIKAWDFDGESFLSFWVIFCPLTLLTTRKIKISKKWKKKNKQTKPGDISILHLYSTNDDHMIYRSSEMKCNWQNFLSIWTIFCPFTPLTTQKIKTLKKWENHHKW